MRENLHIDWKQGMLIMPATFIASDNYQKFQHEVSRRIILQQSFGLLPRVKFDINCSIIDGLLKVQEIHCEALTGNAILIQLSENFTFPLPNNLQGEYFLVVKPQGFVSDEINEIPYSIPEYSFELRHRAEMSDLNVFPIIKIKCENNQWNVQEYIPPCITISSCRQLSDRTEEIRKLINEIFHLLKKDDDYSFPHYSFVLNLLEVNHVTRSETPVYLALLIKKTIQLLEWIEPLKSQLVDDFLNEEYEATDILNLLIKALQLLDQYKTALSTKEVQEIEEEKPPIEEPDDVPKI